MIALAECCGARIAVGQRCDACGVIAVDPSATVFYEAFGCVKDGQQATIRAALNQGSIPDAELFHGISSVHIKVTAYGDDTDDAFIHVHGVDQEAVANAYVRAFDILTETLPRLWST